MLPSVPLPIFCAFSPTPSSCSTVKSRMVISHYLALAADEVFEGSVELDESYFSGHSKGSRGRGVAGKLELRQASLGAI